MSLRDWVARAKRRRQVVVEKKPWQPLGYGWRDRLGKANSRLLQTLKSNPKRFKVELDDDPRYVLITTPPPESRGKKGGWEKKRRHSGNREVTVRLPVQMLKKAGLSHLIQRSNGHKP